jgi:hypothetical protein
VVASSIGPERSITLASRGHGSVPALPSGIDGSLDARPRQRLVIEAHQRQVGREL